MGEENNRNESSRAVPTETSAGEAVNTDESRATSARRPPDHRRRDPDEEARPAKKSFFRRPWVAGGAIVVLIVAVIVGVLWWRHSRHYESTDDAFVDVVAQRVSPQIAGRVSRVLVNDNEDVSAGQVLFEIDPADFQAKLNQARAAYTQAQALVAQAEAQRAIRAAELDETRASAAAAATNATNAASDLRRLEQARNGDEGVASAQQVEHTRGDERSAAAQQHAADQAVAAAEAQLGLVARQIDAARAAAASARAQMAQAELALSYAQVKASVDGRVAQKMVTAGNFVQPGSDLMAIVPRSVYVTADFKETQLRRLLPGQPAEIKVDAYPDLPLHGHVDSVQPATGSAFTPLPAENAAGNWVKVVQRVPVKIAIDDLPNDPNRRLGPGMSVSVKVDVRGVTNGAKPPPGQRTSDREPRASP